jgi:hypothetical protein
MQHMENNEKENLFDDLIRNSMHRMEQNSDDSLSSDFDLFEKRLRRVEQTDDEAFDNWIRNAAERQDVPQNAAHWARMERELEETFSWKRYLLRYKIPELVLSGLAIWTFFNVFDTSEMRKGASAGQKEQIMPSNSSKSQSTDRKIVPLSAPKSGIPMLNPKTDWNKRAGDVPKNNLEQTKLDKNNLLQFKGSEGAPQATIQNPIQSSEGTPFQNPTLPTAVIAVAGGAERNDLKTIRSKNGQGVTAMLPTLASTNLPQQTTLDEENVQILLEDATSNGLAVKDLNNPKKEIQSVEASMADLNSMKQRVELLSTLAMIQPELLKTETPLTVKVPVLENMGYRAHRLRVGMFGAFNGDNANTFFSSVYIAGKAVRATDGYGSGVTVGYRRKKVELESGVTYSYKSYRPVGITAVTGDFANGYETVTPKMVSFNMLHIPIHANYYFLDKKKWSFYGTIGGTATLAMQTDYDVAKTSNAIVSQSRVTDPYASQTQSSISTLYKKGALEGASLDKNYYFTANAGGGVEYHPKTKGRWSLFAQSLYQQHIGSQGVGENQDKISTFSVNVGAKVRL